MPKHRLTGNYTIFRRGISIKTDISLKLSNLSWLSIINWKSIYYRQTMCWLQPKDMTVLQLHAQGSHILL